jgi:hypothetical protein
MTGNPHPGEGVEPGRPTAASQWENEAAGDRAMEDDLTEERQPTPAQREEVAQEETLDP